MFRILLLAIFVFSPACKKVDDKPANDLADPVSAARPVTELGDVVATLQLSSGTKSKELIELIDNFQPGASAIMTMQMPMLLGQLVGVDLSGADLSGPVSIVVLNPEKHENPAALLLHGSKGDALVKAAADAGKETRVRNGLVLIGAPKTVAAAEAFAFGNLGKPGKGLVGTVYPGPLVTAYAQRFDELTAQMNQAMSGAGDQGPFFAVIMSMYKEMFSALGDQSDRIVVTVGTAGKSSELYFRLYPKPGTTLDSFIQAQVPAAHKLISLLPRDDASSMIFSGEMRAGAAREAIFDWSLRSIAALFDPSVGETIGPAMRTWLETFDGGYAASMRMGVGTGVPTMSMNYLMGSTDVDKMRAGWREIMTAFASASGKAPNMMGMKFKVDFKAKAYGYDGVEVDSYATTFDRDSMDPEVAAAMPPASLDQKLYLATFDKVAAMSMAMGGDGQGAIEGMIASARGKAEGFVPKGAIAEAIAQSKGRQESMLMVFDVAAIAKDAPQPVPFQVVTMGLGKEADGALVMRMAISP